MRVGQRLVMRNINARYALYKIKCAQRRQQQIFSLGGMEGAAADLQILTTRCWIKSQASLTTISQDAANKYHVLIEAGVVAPLFHAAA